MHISKITYIYIEMQLILQSDIKVIVVSKSDFLARVRVVAQYACLYLLRSRGDMHVPHIFANYEYILTLC